MAPAPDEPERELRSALPVVADSAGELLCRIAERDPAAFESLYRVYARPVYGLALRRLRDREAAEDATRRAFAAIWRSAATYVPERDDGARWLFTVALSAIDDRPHVEPGAEAEWPAFRVHAAVAELPEEERVPLELAYWGVAARARSRSCSVCRSAPSRSALAAPWSVWRCGSRDWADGTGLMEHTPDLDSVIDGRVHGPERDLFQRVHEELVWAGPLPELPDALARPPAVALRRVRVARPER
jgi:hypothetical protein